MTPDAPSNSGIPPQRLRRRAIASVLVALAIGAVTTVAVAWALAITVDTILYPKQLAYRFSPGAAWTVQPYSWYGSHTESWTPLDWAARSGQSPAEFDSAATTTYAGLPISIESTRILGDDKLSADSGDPINLIEHARGLPFLALGCATAIEPLAQDSIISATRTRNFWGVEYKPSAAAAWDIELIHLPLRPLFPGFYVDTALFASVWWALLFWRPLRRRRRIARGQCPACAYSLSGLPAGTDMCPECGTHAPLAALHAAAAPAISTATAAG